MKQDQFSRWNATKVKARADYTCQRCGSAENLQAHDPTHKHIEWRVGIALCGDCHSQEHPKLSPTLFSNSTNQPYWPNISARNLAKEFGCHNRTIIRRAKSLSIAPGVSLSQKDKERIRNWNNPGGPQATRDCEACQKPFQAPQGSQRKFCPACLVMRVTAGRPPEPKEKK